MARIMAFDYGLKRVGVAVSDPLQIIANTLETQPTNQIFDFIKKYLATEQVETFVVGYPYNHGHQQNPITGHIDAFIQKLNTTYPAIPVQKVDERYTSRIAGQTLLASGVNKKERQKKGHVDAISANLILQSYLAMKGH